MLLNVRLFLLFKFDQYRLLTNGRQTECDLYRLWHNRRVATRMRIELMAAIYDKALKRKDYSGIVDAKKADGTKDDTKSGADIGKIVYPIPHFCYPVHSDAF